MLVAIVEVNVFFAKLVAAQSIGDMKEAEDEKRSI